MTLLEISDRIDYLSDRIAYQAERIEKDSQELESLTAMLDHMLETANEVKGEYIT